MSLKYWFSSPENIFVGLSSKGCLKWLDDSPYLQMLFKLKTGQRLNLQNPVTFNEKLQWLKIHNRNPMYTNLVDKYTVRDYVKMKVGESYLIPLIGVYDTYGDICFEDLPEQFVIKCNHDSGGIYICTDKSKVNHESLSRFFTKKLRCNYFWPGREWPYLNVARKLVVEKYMVDETHKELRDFKIFCFMGEPRIIQVDYNRFNGHLRKMYDTKWNCLGFTTKYPTISENEIEKPKNLDEMLSVARELSKECQPFVRVDLYNTGEHIYFGEMTFFHGGGMERFSDEQWNKKMGSWIDLSCFVTKE